MLITSQKTLDINWLLAGAYVHTETESSLTLKRGNRVHTVKWRKNIAERAVLEEGSGT